MKDGGQNVIKDEEEDFVVVNQRLSEAVLAFTPPAAHATPKGSYPVRSS